jgi:peptide/nickel transport system permease protein
MMVFAVRRFLLFLFSLFVASIVVFWVLNALPADPAKVILGTQATPESVERLQQELGLDRSFSAQYLEWAGAAIKGDLGTSYVTQQEIRPQIVDRMKVTLPLAAIAMVMASAIAIPAGVYSASHHRRLGDALVSVASQLGISIPAFWAGLILITYLSVGRGLFPAGGFPGWDESIYESFRSLFLPAVSIAFVQGAILTRYVRSAVLEVMREDFIRTARAKGLTRSAALWKHGLRNAAIPVVTILGLQLAALIAGTVIIENVFVLPGLGRMIVQGIGRRDLLLVQGATLAITGMILLVNFFVDMAYMFLDPRLRTR